MHVLGFGEDVQISMTLLLNVLLSMVGISACSSIIPTDSTFGHPMSKADLLDYRTRKTFSKENFKNWVHPALNMKYPSRATRCTLP